MVRDGGTPAQRNYARVVITVHDHNDHTPQFSEQILEGKVYENAAVGSVVLTALAIDRDKGENARVTYSITSGKFFLLYNYYYSTIFIFVNFRKHRQRFQHRFKNGYHSSFTRAGPNIFPRIYFIRSGNRPWSSTSFIHSSCAYNAHYVRQR